MSVLRDLEPVFILTWSPVRICCGGDAVVMNRGSRGRRPLFICGRWKQFAWSLRGIQCALYFLFSSLVVSFLDLYFQLRALTSASQSPVTVVGLPVPFWIIYRSGTVDYLLLFSRLIFFLRLSAFVFFLSFSFMNHDVDSNHFTSTVLYT